MDASRAAVSRDGAPLVAIEIVARMGVAELEACLKESLNPRMPVDVLDAVLTRLRSVEAARGTAEPGEHVL
ncbi:hypothetical protein [Actinospica sp.]|uniref:hypothetical protein n=1 Tax=Actinospica sp. TaxID=1872142 RepID=UPI002C170162|nr:hypothetical protein [Actinospica sp.]HWG26061.1 hypothetical protein [Actinospica sp.]